MSLLETLLAEKLLTPREKDIVRLLILGKTNLEVATSLGILERTVKWHLTSVYAKTGAKSRARLTVLCLPLLQRDEELKQEPEVGL